MQLQTRDVAIDAPIVGAKVHGERFYPTMAALALLTVFVGMAPTFFLQAHSDRPGIRPFVLLHVVVFSVWMVLFFVQASLIAAHRTDLHRRLGMVGIALIGAMLALGIVTGIEGARNGWNPGGPFRDSLAFFVVAFRDMVNFGGFAAAGIYYRRRPDVHRRLMLLATTGGLLWPAITRIQPIQGRLPLMYAVLIAFLAASPVRDLIMHRRANRVDVVGALIILATFPLGVVIGNSDRWHDFAAWLIR